MKTVKQIIEQINYSNDENHIVSGLSQLVESGLLDESKMPLIKRALTKTNINEMTEAERKVLLESLNLIVSEITEAKRDHLTAFDKRMPQGYPSDKEAPPVLILKRKAIRVYPDNQKVALYYSQALDKHISIPFGPNSDTAGIQISEARKRDLTYSGSDPEVRDLIKKQREEDRQRKSLQAAYAVIRAKKDQNTPSILQKIPGGNFVKTVSAMRDVERKSREAGFTGKATGTGLKAAEAEITSRPVDTFLGSLNPAAFKFGQIIGAKLAKNVAKISGPSAPKTTSNTSPVASPETSSKPVEKEIKRSSTSRLQNTVVGGGKVTPKVNRPVKESFIQKLEEKRLSNSLNMTEAWSTPEERAEWENRQKNVESIRKSQSDIRSYEDKFERDPSAENRANLENAYKQKGATAAAAVMPGGRDALKQIETQRGTADPNVAAKIKTAGEIGAGFSAGGRAVKAYQAVKGAIQTARAARAARGAGGAKLQSNVPGTRVRTRNDKSKGGDKSKKGGDKSGAGSALGAAAAAALSAFGGDNKPPGAQRPQYEFGRVNPQAIDPVQGAARAFGTVATGQERKSQESLWKNLNEQSNFNKIRILSGNKDVQEDLLFEDTSITVNNRVAKKIMNLHESLNKENKRKIEKMINEDISSFKKIINFAVRHN